MTSAGLAPSVLRRGPSFQQPPRHASPQPPEPNLPTAAPTCVEVLPLPAGHVLLTERIGILPAA